jgi:4-hydroxymandelate oxidase
MTTAINIADFEAEARARMEPSAFDYYAGGAGDELTLAANRAAFAEVFLRPRVLVDVTRVDTAVTVLGQRLEMPILIAPTAFQRLAHSDGELATARAAGRAGTVMVASTIATHTLEDIAAAAGGPLWFQLYVYRDREVTLELVRRAEAAGYRAIVVTVDTPHLGRRERDLRNAFQLPPGVAIANFAHLGGKMARAAGWNSAESFAKYVHDLMDASLSWEAISWIRSQTSLPIVLKGILTAEDALRAAGVGADAVIVSNHGGRQLDGVLPTLRALPPIAEALAGAPGECQLLMDGGVRRGADVLKALALGARAVLVGRAVLWGLAAGGEEGVVRVLALLREELELALRLSGRPSIAGLDHSLVTGPEWTRPAERSASMGSNR